MENIIKLKKILQFTKNIVITSHINPDGDAIGSSLAFASYLRKHGHNVSVILPNDAPSTLQFAEGYDEALIYLHQESLCREKLNEADIFFAMDYNDINSRIGNMSNYISTLTNLYKIAIDHHLDPADGVYDILFSDTKASSTSFLAFKIIQQMGDVDMIDLGMANNLYLGIMTDTGNLSYGNLTAELYRSVATLIELGVSPVKLNITMANHQKESRLRIMGYALYNKMVLLPELKSAYIWLTSDELAKFNHSEGDTEGLVNMPLSIDGIVNSAIFMEKKDSYKKSSIIKISLRSQDDDGLDMNNFARTYFTGGGHRNASGAKSLLSMEETIDIYVNGLKEIENK